MYSWEELQEAPDGVGGGVGWHRQGLWRQRPLLEPWLRDSLDSIAALCIVRTGFCLSAFVIGLSVWVWLSSYPSWMDTNLDLTERYQDQSLGHCCSHSLFPMGLGSVC